MGRGRGQTGVDTKTRSARRRRYRDETSRWLCAFSRIARCEAARALSAAPRRANQNARVSLEVSLRLRPTRRRFRACRADARDGVLVGHEVESAVVTLSYLRRRYVIFARVVVSTEPPAGKPLGASSPLPRSRGVAAGDKESSTPSRSPDRTTRARNTRRVPLFCHCLLCTEAGSPVRGIPPKESSGARERYAWSSAGRDGAEPVTAATPCSYVTAAL